MKIMLFFILKSLTYFTKNIFSHKIKTLTDNFWDSLIRIKSITLLSSKSSVHKLLNAILNLNSNYCSTGNSDLISGSTF